ncbi:hypothetical protein [Streptomyces sp. Tue6028]|uniref:hypothetical protein n=1 Tax=Streptomyces sp. Tue6028 TaxID=2036037 RepID=UPI003D75B9D0
MAAWLLVDQVGGLHRSSTFSGVGEAAAGFVVPGSESLAEAVADDGRFGCFEFRQFLQAPGVGNGRAADDDGPSG